MCNKTLEQLNALQQELKYKGLKGSDEGNKPTPLWMFYTLVEILRQEVQGVEK